MAKTTARPLQGERERKCLSIAGSETRDTGMQVQYTDRVGQEQVVASSPSCCQVPQQKCQATRNRKQLMLLVLPFTQEGEMTRPAHCLASNTPVPLHKAHPYTICLHSPLLKMTTPMNPTSLENDKSQIREPPPRIKTSDAIYFDFQSNPHSPYKSLSGFEWARLSLLSRQGRWRASSYQSAYVRVCVCTVATVTTLIGGLVCQ